MNAIPENIGAIISYGKIIPDDRFTWLSPEERAAIFDMIGTYEIDRSAYARTYLDVQYGTLPQQLLDVYLPSEGDGPFPVIFYVHGGGWMYGSKSSSFLYCCLDGIRRGYAVISVDYRRIPAVRYPENLMDVKTAVRWARANAKNYCLDPDRFGMIGDSAGAHITMLMGLTAGREELEGRNYGWAGESSVIQAMCSQYGPTELLLDDEMYLESGCPRFAPKTDPSVYHELFGTDAPNILRMMSPVYMVHPSMPPILLQHGTADGIIPYQMAQLMYDQVRSVCGAGRAQLDIFEGWIHSDPRFMEKDNVERVLNFFDETLR